MQIDLNSARRRIEDSVGQVDVYDYETIALPLRVQLVQIFRCSLGPAYRDQRDDSPAPSWIMWHSVRLILRREYGVHQLTNEHSPESEVLIFLEGHATASQVIDVAEILCRLISSWAAELPSYTRDHHRITEDAAEAIKEINLRFQRASCGFRFAGNDMIRIDSEFIHKEVVLPVLLVLQHHMLAGSNNEFRDAHKHMRLGESEPAIVSASKSFESAMKAIHTFKGWDTVGNATASDLISGLYSNGLFDSGTKSQLTALRATLEQGVPSIRNRSGCLLYTSDAADE